FGSYCTISSLCPLLSYLLHLSIFFALIRRPPISALFPYTTLFRSGLASGLLGIGGGIIKVPVMNLAMKVPMRVAVATSNFMVGITAAASAVVYYANGLVDPLVASAAALAVLVGGNLGARTAGRGDQGMLARVFAVVLAVLALQMLYRVLGSAGG